VILLICSCCESVVEVSLVHWVTCMVFCIPPALGALGAPPYARRQTRPRVVQHRTRNSAHRHLHCEGKPCRLFRFDELSAVWLYSTSSMLPSPSSKMGERGLPSWKGSSRVKATRRESYSSSLEGSKPFQYTKRPCSVDVMVKPR
jgi:hypothetical protein